MPGFLSMKVAPGVRLSASSRGLRAHVGPRAARIHVGGGGTGISTGAGPFTYYAPLRTTSGHGRPHQAAQAAPIAPNLDKAQQAEIYARQFDAIAQLHRHVFMPATKPVAQPPVLPDFRELLEQAEQRELAGIGVLAFKRRKAARTKARSAAENQALSLMTTAPREHARRQQEADAYWERLVVNDADVVLPLLERAFEDNQAPVAAVGVDGAEASLVVLVPGPEGVPEKAPGRTPSGNLSLKKLTKADQMGWHRALVAGHLLLSAREAFAVAPGLRSASLLGVRRAPGSSLLVPLLALRLGRQDLEASDPASAAWDVVMSIGQDVRFETKGAAKELVALDLSDEPDLESLLNSVEE